MSNVIRDVNGRFVKGLTTGEHHTRWKGDKVGYFALHSWLYKINGKANICCFCGLSDPAKCEWANISGKYKRDISDWISLCQKCHFAFDGRGEKISLKNKGKKRTQEQIDSLKRRFKHIKKAINRGYDEWLSRNENYYKEIVKNKKRDLLGRFISS